MLYLDFQIKIVFLIVMLMQSFENFIIKFDRSYHDVAFQMYRWHIIRQYVHQIMQLKMYVPIYKKIIFLVPLTE